MEKRSALIVRRKVVAEHRLGLRQKKQIILFLLRQALILRELPSVRRVVEGLLQHYSSIVLREKRGSLGPIDAVIISIDIETGTHAQENEPVLGKTGIPGFLADVVGHARHIEGGDLC